MILGKKLLQDYDFKFINVDEKTEIDQKMFNSIHLFKQNQR